jgi:hypothetical protein
LIARPDAPGHCGPGLLGDVSGGALTLSTMKRMAKEDGLVIVADM